MAIKTTAHVLGAKWYYKNETQKSENPHSGKQPLSADLLKEISNPYEADFLYGLMQHKGSSEQMVEYIKTSPFDLGVKSAALKRVGMNEKLLAEVGLSTELNNAGLRDVAAQEFSGKVMGLITGSDATIEEKMAALADETYVSELVQYILVMDNDLTDEADRHTADKNKISAGTEFIMSLKDSAAKSMEAYYIDFIREQKKLFDSGKISEAMFKEAKRAAYSDCEKFTKTIKDLADALLEAAKKIQSDKESETRGKIAESHSKRFLTDVETRRINEETRKIVPVIREIAAKIVMLNRNIDQRHMAEIEDTRLRTTGYVHASNRRADAEVELVDAEAAREHAEARLDVSKKKNEMYVSFRDRLLESLENDATFKALTAGLTMKEIEQILGETETFGARKKKTLAEDESLSEELRYSKFVETVISKILEYKAEKAKGSGEGPVAG